ncbi:unnamed protein product [Soboliphyme baturini]|uniref:Uncharacterized protein n=1 Tax=Soboliphyme baturini TaxID=241478 RepID=A0A3P8CTN9_9BILA|nr:unnamed protein product [Soboliphyme baturini]
MSTVTRSRRYVISAGCVSGWSPVTGGARNDDDDKTRQDKAHTTGAEGEAAAVEEKEGTAAAQEVSPIGLKVNKHRCKSCNLRFSHIIKSLDDYGHRRSPADSSYFVWLPAETGESFGCLTAPRPPDQL